MFPSYVLMDNLSFDTVLDNITYRFTDDELNGSINVYVRQMAEDSETYSSDSETTNSEFITSENSSSDETSYLSFNESHRVLPHQLVAEYHHQ